MMKPFGRGLAIVAVAALAAGLAASPSQAHHSDWGLPLVGGLVGGAGLTALYYNSQQHSQPRTEVVQQPVYVTPAAAPAAPAVPSATTIEDKLNVLDQLAAKGYITPAQYQARRQALLDQL
jgi:drug/metabolite transporter (DMT)-like permease